MYDAEEVLEEAKPNPCRTCCYYIWKLVSCIFSHIILVSLVVAYCILGAFTFESLEAGHEVQFLRLIGSPEFVLPQFQVKAEVSAYRTAVSNRLWNMTKNVEVLRQENWTREVKEYLKDFETDLLTAMKKNGWDGTEDQEVTQWTFAGALFYSIIVITTIGYGHIAPKTHWGKVVTILYAILGIPLMLLCLSNIGDVMAHSFRFIYWRVCCYMCTRKPKRTPSRRGRSVRGTIRSSGGRYSGRSRSLKQPPMRTSTRSADSALGMSESVTRSSYSDTECRYNDTEFNGERQQRPPHSRYSEAVATTHAGDVMAPPTPRPRPKREPKSHSVEPDFARFEMNESLDLQTPVLFNKYALDRNESMRAGKSGKFSQSSQTLPRQHHQQFYPNPQYQSSPYGGSLKRNADAERQEISSPRIYSNNPRPNRKAPTVSSPRIMTPMGFAVARQTTYRPARLGRLREDMDYGDYEFDEYDYDTNSGSQATKIRPVPIWLCVFLVVSYIFGGAFLFSEWENWHFLDSAYFCFITLTTIGFGDFVPAQRVQKNAEISIALCSLYLLFGIALLAMSFNLVQEEVINNVKAIAKRLGIIKEDDDEDM